MENGNEVSSSTQALQRTNSMPHAKKLNLDSHPSNGQKSYISPYQRQTNPEPQIDPLFLPIFPHSDDDINKFEMIDMIAKGSFGQVWRARLTEPNDHRVFALKVMEKSRLLLEGRAGPLQCKLEVTTQNAVKGHPFIISIFHCWQTLNQIYIVSELAPLGELHQLWRQIEVLSDSLVMFYLAEIACALDFIHSKNILFRDLKMENLLIDGEGHARLTDFGLARWLPPSGKARTICGTLQYTAPEVLQGRPYSFSCDWWSLGIIAYAMLCGQLPVTGARNHVQMMEWVDKCKFQLLKDREYSKPALKLIKKLLQKSSKKRLKSIDKLCKLEFFKPIDFDRLRQRQYNPGDFFTGSDLKRLPESSFVFQLINSTLV